MVLIGINYCKLNIKQPLYKHTYDKVPLIVICIESLTTKLAHSVYNRNTCVYSIQDIAQFVSNCFPKKREVISIELV